MSLIVSLSCFSGKTLELSDWLETNEGLKPPTKESLEQSWPLEYWDWVALGWRNLVYCLRTYCDWRMTWEFDPWVSSRGVLIWLFGDVKVSVPFCFECRIKVSRSFLFSSSIPYISDRSWLRSSSACFLRFYSRLIVLSRSSAAVITSCECS